MNRVQIFNLGNTEGCSDKITWKSYQYCSQQDNHIKIELIIEKKIGKRKEKKPNRVHVSIMGQNWVTDARFVEGIVSE